MATITSVTACGNEFILMFLLEIIIGLFIQKGNLQNNYIRLFDGLISEQSTLGIQYSYTQ